MDDFATQFLDVFVRGTPLGYPYTLVDKNFFGGKLPSGAEPDDSGAPVVMPDGDIKYKTPGYGLQSGESYKKVTGQYPKGFKPAPTDNRTQQPAAPRGYDSGSSTPPAAPTLPGEPSKDTIEQKSIPEFQQMRDELRRMLDPATIQRLSDIATERSIVTSAVTNALALKQSKELTARKIEEANINAWRDARVAQINANATQAAALASAIWASTQMNPSVVSEGFKAAFRPITITGRA